MDEKIFQSGFFAKAATKARFNVWESTIMEINKKPLIGHGIEAQRFIESDHLIKYFKTENQTLHAHNVILQIWLEFGLIGILLACIFLIYIFKRIYTEENIATRKLYIIIFATSFCCVMTGYGIWQGWQLGMIFLFTALAKIFSNGFEEKNYKI